MDRTSFCSSCRSAVSTVVKFLNKQEVKEGIKDISGIVSFAFGFLEMYDLYKIIRGRPISSEEDKSTISNAKKKTDSFFKNWFGITVFGSTQRWVIAANKTIIICSKLSIILSAGVSRPSLYIISFVANKIFTQQQLVKTFGPNTTFALNPHHPRHIVSLAAFILSIPGFVQSIVKTGYWIHEKIKKIQKVEIKSDRWLTDCKVRFMVSFNLITSRPFLHLGNRFFRSYR